MCIFDVCVCVFCLCRDWFCGLTWERVYIIWEEFWNVQLLIGKFAYWLIFSSSLLLFVCLLLLLWLCSEEFMCEHFILSLVWLISCFTSIYRFRKTEMHKKGLSVIALKKRVFSLNQFISSCTSCHSPLTDGRLFLLSPTLYVPVEVWSLNHMYWVNCWWRDWSCKTCLWQWHFPSSLTGNNLVTRLCLWRQRPAVRSDHCLWPHRDFAEGTSDPSFQHIILQDLDLYITGTIFGHFCNGAGRVQCKYNFCT